MKNLIYILLFCSCGVTTQIKDYGDCYDVITTMQDGSVNIVNHCKQYDTITKINYVDTFIFNFIDTFNIINDTILIEQPIYNYIDSVVYDTIGNWIVDAFEDYEVKLIPIIEYLDGRDSTIVLEVSMWNPYGIRYDSLELRVKFDGIKNPSIYSKVNYAYKTFVLSPLPAGEYWIKEITMSYYGHEYYRSDYNKIITVK